MKKILIVLTGTILLMASCNRRSHYIIGDEYIVTKVEKYSYSTYNTNYVVHANCLNTNSKYCTWDGNHFVYYTNVLYSVGDTIQIAKKK